MRGLGGPAWSFDAGALAAIREAFDGASASISSAMARETGYRDEECRELMDATRRFIDGLPDLVRLHQSLAKTENDLYRALSPEAELRYEPWGRCLVCTPANAPAPLALALPLSLAAAGNRVAVAFSGKAIESASALARIVSERVGGITLWGGRVRDAVETLTASRAVDLVYFLGGSSYFPKLAAQCASAGIELVYEGEGNSVALLHEDARGDLATVARQLVASKQAFGGRMCSSPNAIAVPRPLLRELMAEFRRAASEVGGEPIAGWISPQIRAYLDELVARGGARVDGSIDDARGPLLVEGPDLRAALERELFCPLAFVVPYDDWDAVVREIGAVPHRLQLTVYSADVARTRRLARETSFARYCTNMNPIAQDPLLPWGNYGVSGRADVLDFYRKGLRRAILEWRSVER